MAEAYWGMSNNCNWPNMSLWDLSKCFSSSNALHISGLDPLLEEWWLLRVTFLRTSQQHTDASWQQSDNWSVLCTQTQWSSGRIPRKLLQTICFMMRFKGGILYWVVAGVAKVCSCDVHPLNFHCKIQIWSKKKCIYGRLASLSFCDLLRDGLKVWRY